MDEGKHTPQHQESPTWCVVCGTYDVYFDRVRCAGDGRKYDSAVNGKQMLQELFGLTATIPQKDGPND
jgi:hypothetical protein